LPGSFALLLYALAAFVGIPGAFIGLIFASRLSKESHKILLFSSLMVIVLTIGLLLGGAWYRASDAASLVLVGSSNVKAHLESRLSLQKREWLDVPSGDALGVLFHAFEYGTNSSLGDNREALLGLSSHGTRELEKSFAGATKDEQNANYWLSIQLGNPKLVVLYSEPADKDDLALFPKIAKGPDYDWISYAELKKFLVIKSTGHVRRYIPEPHTGTRLLLKKHAGVTQVGPTLEVRRNILVRALRTSEALSSTWCRYRSRARQNGPPFASNSYKVI
jgi:hypothetical protein